jgi:hypothetical protein
MRSASWKEAVKQRQERATDRERGRRCHQELDVYERAFAMDMESARVLRVKKLRAGGGGGGGGGSKTKNNPQPEGRGNRKQQKKIK